MGIPSVKAGTMKGSRVGHYLVISGIFVSVLFFLMLPELGKNRSYRLFAAVYVVAKAPDGKIVVGEQQPDNTEELGTVRCWHPYDTRGLFSACVHDETWALGFDWIVTPVSPERESEARAAVVAQLVADGLGKSPGFSAAKLAAGDYSVRTHNIHGYVNDGIACILLFGVGVLWVQGLVWASRADKRERLARRGGVCISCGYDTRGLRSTKCPECGERV